MRRNVFTLFYTTLLPLKLLLFYGLMIFIDEFIIINLIKDNIWQDLKDILLHFYLLSYH